MQRSWNESWPLVVVWQRGPNGSTQSELRTYRAEAALNVGDVSQAMLAVVAEGLNDLLQVGLRTEPIGAASAE
jgi:hypothetical protein